MLFDTHTHFDVEEFDMDRDILAYQAKKNGVDGLVLIGITQARFLALLDVHQQLNSLTNAPKSYVAPGLHPFYIAEHHKEHLLDLEHFLKNHACVAIGEIGLDTFFKVHKTDTVLKQQIYFFEQQLQLAKIYQKPILLHIRKAHAQVLALLKKHQFKFGGIAHAFSGGVEEAKAFVKLGFKLGITGQITNLNAKKLHQVVYAVGIEHLVIETDCPDMTPLCCQISTQKSTRNTPANLPYVLKGLAQTLDLPIAMIEPILWQNSLNALHLN